LPTWARAKGEGDGGGQGEAALEPQLLVGLIDLLRQQNLAAVGRFGAIASQLERRLGPGPYAQVLLHMDNLRFNDAIKLLEHSPAQLG
jgi:hypothetical protein